VTGLSRSALRIYDLATRHPGLTVAVASYFAEAARVCLDRHHKSPTDFRIEGENGHLEADVTWDESDARTRAAWANDIEATESGAYACVLAALELSEQLVAVHRAETRTGADYYVATVGSAPGDLEGCFRLEVSGVDSGGQAVVESRLRSKVAQTRRGNSNLPALAGVAGFRARLILFQYLRDIT
jgi:hypothetical protein